MDLDKKDMKILYQLDLNSRQSDAEIAKKVRLNKNTVWYRINRLMENGVIRKFVTLVNPVKFGKSVFKLYVRLQDMTDEAWNEIKIYLIQHKQVFWVTRNEGNWDIITAVWAKTPFDFYEFYSDFSARFNKFISEKQVTNQIEVPFFSRSYLSNGEGQVKCLWGGQVTEEKVDETDMKILEILAANARIPSAEIASKLKITPRIASYRIKEMMKRKIILAFSIELNQDTIDYDYYKVIFYLKSLTRQKENAFIEFCRSQGNIIYYIKTLGPWELELEIEAKNHKELNKIMNSIRKEFGDIIKSYEPLLITEEYKGEYNTLG